MEKRFFKNLGANISLLGFCSMRFPCMPEQFGGKGAGINLRLCEALIDRAFAAGINYFDCAFMYLNHTSELILGNILRNYQREKYYLADKIPVELHDYHCHSLDDADNILNEQLKRCQTSYFDFYLVHAMDAQQYEKCVKLDIYNWLIQKKKEGLVHHIGFSFHDCPELFQTILDNHQWDFVQIQLNYVDWNACRAKELYRIAEERQVPLAIMEPLRGGHLTNLPEEARKLLRAENPDASEASWGIRFAASLPNVMTVLSGMNSLAQVEDNIKTMQNFLPLSNRELEILKRVEAIYLSSGDIPCTGCRYCMDCPHGVDIPSVFSVYNFRNISRLVTTYPI
jgi:predicted aldo/keto reductase-like oxidoreductase